MPPVIQINPALLACGFWLWTGTEWVRAPGGSATGLKVNLAGSAITLNTYTYPTAGTHNVAVQNWPGNQPVTPYPNNFSTLFAAANTLVKSGAGYLHSVVLANTQTAPRYIILYNNTAAADPRLLVIQSPAQDTRGFSFFPGLYFSTGLYLVVQEAAFCNVTLAYY